MLDIIKDIIFYYLIWSILNQFYINLRGYGLIGYFKLIYKLVVKFLFQWFLNLPFIKKKVHEEVNSVLKKIETSLIKECSIVPSFKSLPSKGLSDSTIHLYLNNLSQVPHSEWENGKVSGAVYHGGQDLIDIQSHAFHKFCVANQLHPDVFPGVRKMEAEVVSMVLKLFNAPKGAVGSTSSGGTESLLLACLSAKTYCQKKRINKPEMIIPVTAHAGFDKASYYFGIKLHHVSLGSDYKVNIRSMEKLINKNTVLLVGSAPNFPHGIIDDIQAIGSLGLKYDIPVHVDCCLGSFIVSYMSKAGFELPEFDFRVPGVTSISCDTHKYGFAPKGSSIIMYKNSKLRESQYYINPDWVGGIYGSPTLAGSRPGALIVGCWATLLKMGDDGYIQSCKDIIGAARELKKEIQKIKELSIIGDPLTSVISFKSDIIDVYELSDLLGKKGWHLSTLQKPPALHLAVTRLSIPIIDELIKDIKECIIELMKFEKEEKKEEKLNKKKKKKGETSALYGVAGSVSSTGVVDRLVVGFLDTLYKT